MMIPKHFHVVNQSNFSMYQCNGDPRSCVNRSKFGTIFNRNSCSNAYQINAGSGDDDQFSNDSYNERIPTEIKCSLCSTPRNSSPYTESLYETAESHDSGSNISVILPTNDQTDSNSTENDHYANRFIVRIFASSK